MSASSGLKESSSECCPRSSILRNHCLGSAPVQEIHTLLSSSRSVFGNGGHSEHSSKRHRNVPANKNRLPVQQICGTIVLEVLAQRVGNKKILEATRCGDLRVQGGGHFLRGTPSRDSPRCTCGRPPGDEGGAPGHPDKSLFRSSWYHSKKADINPRFFT